MTNADLIDFIAVNHGLTKGQAKDVLTDVFGAIVHAASAGTEVSLAGFGKFTVKSLPERGGRNPATGEAIRIPASKKLTFSPAKAVKDALNR